MEYKSSADILAEIKKGIVKPIYILHGDESHFIDEVVDYVEEHFLSESEKAFNQSILYGRDIDFKQVQDHARQYPMMAERRVVIIKEAQFMRDLGSLESYFSNPAPQTLLLIAHKNKKVDGRVKWMKEAKKSEAIGILVASKIPDYRLGQWLSTYLSRKNRKMDPEAQHLMCEYLGNDLKKLVNELDKLDINVPKADPISADHIERFVGISKQFNVFELLKSIGLRDLTRVQLIARTMEANLRKEPLQMILPSFFNYFQKVMITHQNPSTPDNALAGILRVHPNFAREYRSAARNYSPSKLKEIFTILKNTDLRGKGMDYRGPTEELFKEMVGKIVLLE